MSNTLTMNVVLKLVDEMSSHVQQAVDKSKKHLDSFAEHAQKVGQELRSFGTAAGAVGLAIGAGVGVAVKQFATVESVMANLRSTMTGKDGLSANFLAVEKLTTDLSSRFKGNTADLAGMVNKLLQLGVTEESVLGGVAEASAKLSVVLNLPYEEAANIVGRLSKSTDVAQEDMLNFVDTIQRVSHLGVSASEMMEAFAKSGSGLKQLGIQGEVAARQVGTLFAQVIGTGISGQTAGTALASILNRLLQFSNQSTAPAREAAEQLKALGIQLEFFDKKSGEFKGVQNVIAEFDKLSGLKQTEAGTILQNMFGGGQDQQIVALLMKQGLAGNAAMQARLDVQADLTTRARIQQETLVQKWDAAFGNFENLLAKIGKLLAPKLSEFVDWFGDVSTRLAKWMDENKGIAEAATLVIAGLGTALAGLGGAALVAGAIVSAVGAIASGLSAIASAGPALVALASNPILLALVAAAGAGFAGWKIGEWINEQITTATSALTGTQGETLGTALFGLVESITNTFSKLPGITKNAFAATVKAIRDHFQAFVDAGKFIVDGLINGLKAKFNDVVQAAKDLAGAIPDWVQKTLRMKSPSLVMQELGQQTAVGFALGLTLGTAQVAEAAAAMANQVPTVAAVAAQAAERSELQYLTATVQYRKLNLESANFFFGQLGALMQTRSRSLFQIGKAAAIAETIIDTYRAAQKAFAALAGIPIVGPALGAAAAAAAVVAGLARVQAIRSTEIGGASGSPVLSGGGFSGPVISSGAGVSVPAEPVNAVPAPPQRDVFISLHGTAFNASTIRDELIPLLNDAIGDGVRLHVQAG